MKFANIRVSEYFTRRKRISHFAEIFHLHEDQISLKKALLSKCFFLAPPAGLEPCDELRFATPHELTSSCLSATSCAIMMSDSPSITKESEQEMPEAFASGFLVDSPNWVNEGKTINNCFADVKSTKQGVTKQIYDLRTLRLCDLTGA